MKKTKVLHINRYFTPSTFGGATIVAENIVYGLQDFDCFDNLALSLNLSDQNVTSQLRSGSSKGLDVVVIDAPWPKNKFEEYRRTDLLNSFINLLKAYQPDIVLIHAFQGFGAVLIQELIVRKIPYVIFVHDYWWLCYRQFMVNKQNTDCKCELLSEFTCFPCYEVVDDFDLLVTTNKYLLENASKVVFPSEYIKTIYFKNHNNMNSALIPNGVNVPRKVEKKLSNVIRFGYVGGYGGLKGSDTIYDAFKLLLDDRWILKIVDATSNLSMRELGFESWKLGPKLEILSGYTMDTIDDFFAQIDVLLFPSKVRESFGLTVREALIRDKWVIATKCGGVVDAIVDGENGTLIDMDCTGEEFSLAIKNLIERNLSDYKNKYRSEIVTVENQVEAVAKLVHEIIQE